MQAPCGGLPEAVRVEEVVGEGAELAHDGGGANLGCLPQSRRRWQKAAGLVVGEVAGESAGFEIRVEPALPDVNAGGDGGHAARHRWPGSSRAARYTVRVRVLRVLDLRRSETPAPAADSQDH